jgi:hypothetical protein
VRVRARTDANHVEIGLWLRRYFPAVEDTRQFGGGMSDYLVRTAKGELLLIEVKDGTKPPSRRRLTDVQQKWRAKFGASYRVVTCVDDVFKLANA